MREVRIVDGAVVTLLTAPASAPSGAVTTEAFDSAEPDLTPSRCPTRIPWEGRCGLDVGHGDRECDAFPPDYTAMRWWVESQAARPPFFGVEGGVCEVLTTRPTRSEMDEYFDVMTDARRAGEALVKEFGSGFLPLVFQEIGKTLYKQGYRKVAP